MSDLDRIFDALSDIASALERIADTAEKRHALMEREAAYLDGLSVVRPPEPPNRPHVVPAGGES